VAELLPELREAAYGHATVRQVMDMLVGLDYSEDYADPQAGIWISAAPAACCRGARAMPGRAASASSWPRCARRAGMARPLAKTVNTQVLGWLLERVHGERLADDLAPPVAAAGHGARCLDLGRPSGAAFGGGGMSATLRDLARFGELMRLRGQVGGRQRCCPRRWWPTSRPVAGAVPRAEAYHATLPGWSYRSMWWVSHNAHGAYMARGVHGQCLYIDPRAEMVIARTGLHPVAGQRGRQRPHHPARLRGPGPGPQGRAESGIPRPRRAAGSGR
jgi:CubicO group peptidase (beta-lactamase class C family)